MAVTEQRTMTLNMGPQHPSTHGVLRLILELDGEIVVGITPVLGYLHRAIGKIGETLHYEQFVPYTDRLDYLAATINNLGYVQAAEKLMVSEKGLAGGTDKPTSVESTPPRTPSQPPEKCPPGQNAAMRKNPYNLLVPTY